MKFEVVYTLILHASFGNRELMIFRCQGKMNGQTLPQKGSVVYIDKDPEPSFGKDRKGLEVAREEHFTYGTAILEHQIVLAPDECHEHWLGTGTTRDNCVARFEHYCKSKLWPVLQKQGFYEYRFEPYR